MYLVPWSTTVFGWVLRVAVHVFFFFFFQHADTNVLPAVCQQFGFGPLLFQQENT